MNMTSGSTQPPLLPQIYRVILMVGIVASGVVSGIGAHVAQHGGSDLLTPCCIGVVLWGMVMAGARVFPGYPFLLGLVWIVVTLGVMGLLALF